jgi:hypothetical protein
MSKFEVRTLTEFDYRQWDHLVAHSEQGTVFHSSAWINTVAKMHKFDPVIIGVFSHGELTGGCSFFQTEVLRFYRKGTTEVTLTPYGGVVIADRKSSHVRECETREHEVISLILEKIDTLHLINVTLTNGPGMVDMRPFTQNGWKETVKYCYIFNLTGPVEDQFSKKIRWSIHKAVKAGIIVRQQWNKDLYWDLTLNTYRKQGKQPPFSRELFFSLLDQIENSGCGEMWIAETGDGDWAAAEVVLWNPHMAYRWQAASHADYKDTEAPTLLLSEIMKHLQERGFKRFNLMAANTPQFAKFISSFNPELVPYYSVQKIQGIYRIPGMIRSLISK